MMMRASLLLGAVVLLLVCGSDARRCRVVKGSHLVQGTLSQREAWA